MSRSAMAGRSLYVPCTCTWSGVPRYVLSGAGSGLRSRGPVTQFHRIHFFQRKRKFVRAGRLHPHRGTPLKLASLSPKVPVVALDPVGVDRFSPRPRRRQHAASKIRRSGLFSQLKDPFDSRTRPLCLAGANQRLRNPGQARESHHAKAIDLREEPSLSVASAGS